MKGDARNIRRMPVEGKDCVGVCGFDIIEFDGVVPCGSEVAFVGRNAEAVDLRVGVGDCTGADAAEGFPEAAVLVSVRWNTLSRFA